MVTILMLTSPSVRIKSFPPTYVNLKARLLTSSTLCSSQWINIPTPTIAEVDEMNTNSLNTLDSPTKDISFTPHCPPTTKHMLGDRVVYQFRDDLHTLPGPSLIGNKSRCVGRCGGRLRRVGG